MQMIFWDTFNQQYDYKQVEQVYQRLVEQPWQGDEPDFPFDLKLKFLGKMFEIFNDLNQYTRSVKILDLIEELTTKNPDHVAAGYIYVISLTKQNSEVATMKDLDIEKYMDKIDEVAKRYSFDRDQVGYIEFKKNNLYLGYYASHQGDKW